MFYKDIIKDVLSACLLLFMKQILLGIAPGTLFHKGVHMRVTKRDWGSLYETDVLILGTLASGMGEALKAAIEERIREKTDESLVGNMVSEGTTPRRLTDLIGSLCDLTSGSGDKGTPIVYIQGYFDNYSND